MSTTVLIVSILVALGLAVYSVRVLVGLPRDQRTGRLALLLVAAALGVSVVWLLRSLLLSAGVVGDDVTVDQLLPLGLITGVGVVELGPALSRAALRVIGRKARETAANEEEHKP